MTTADFPLVGREAERRRLRAHLDEAIAGHGRLAILSGEAGIGKTALCRDLAAAATEQGALALVGHCYDLSTTPPYGPWLDLAAHYRPASGLPPLPAVLAEGQIGEIESQAAFFAHVRGFFVELAAVRPVLIVLEDLHWADLATIDLLRHLGPRLAALPILVVVTYRIDDLTRRHPLYRQLPALVREAEGERFDLRRLGAADVRALIAGRWPLAAVDQDRLATYLDRHAEGNPFFAIELLRALHDEGFLRPRPDGEGWDLEALPGVVLPPLIRQVIDLRVSKLGEEAKEALALAALIGQEVPLALWAAVAGLSEEDLLETVERAVESRLLDATPDGTHVHFVHALTRETLYEGVLPPRRRLWHRQVAEALMAGPVPDPDAVAYHLQQGGDPRAWEWLARAGNRAQRAYAWLTAAERCLAAAALLDEEPGQERTRARLLNRAGRLLRYANPAQGLTALAEAQQLAHAGDDRVLAADATYSLGLLRCFAGDFGRGILEMETGIAALEGLPPDEARPSWEAATWLVDAVPAGADVTATTIDPAVDALAAHGIHHRRGGLPWFLAAAGRLIEAEAMGRHFIACAGGLSAGPPTRSALGHSYHGLGIAYAALGRPAEARQALAAARDVYRGLDHHAVIAFTLLTELRDVVLVYQTTDLTERTRVAAEAEEALDRAGGALLGGGSPRRAWLSVMMLEGRWDEIVAVTAGAPAPGNYYLRREVDWTLATLAYRRGDPDLALVQVRSLLPHGPATEPGGVYLDSLIAQRAAAELAIERGDLSGARAWLEANDRWLAWSGGVLGDAEGQTSWASLHRAAGDLGPAMRAAIAAVRRAEEPSRPFALLKALRMRGRIGGEMGDRAAAERDLTAALALAVACAAPYERALTLLEIASLRLSAGLGAGAVPILAEARLLLEPLAATPALNRLASLEAAWTSAATTSSPIAGLTRRERDVLRLVADGLTDAAIAERLFISPRTVSQHLRSIYAKLGVSSRAAATRFAVEHGLT